MEEIVKAKSVQAVAGVPDEEDLELIYQYTIERLEPSELFIFSVILCDNEIDRDYERFSVKSLETLKDMYTGVTGIFDHNAKSENQTARIYKTELAADSDRRTAAGEIYTCVKAKCYMVRTEKNRDLIKEIQGGIKKEVSVSCRIGNVICSECGKDVRSCECLHIPGEKSEKGGGICHAVLENPTDAYEWSFVAVPAQRGAGVSKSYAKKQKLREREKQRVSDNLSAENEKIESPEDFEKALSETSGSLILSKEQSEVIKNYIEVMKNQAQRGRMKRLEDEKDIVSLAAFTLPLADGEILSGILKKLNDEEIDMLKKSLAERGERLEIYSPSLVKAGNGKISDNSQFRI